MCRLAAEDLVGRALADDPQNVEELKGSIKALEYAITATNEANVEVSAEAQRTLEGWKTHLGTLVLHPSYNCMLSELWVGVL